jgi:hypothetical protein
MLERNFYFKIATPSERWLAMTFFAFNIITLYFMTPQKAPETRRANIEE